jgi:hypothetical protein
MADDVGGRAKELVGNRWIALSGTTSISQSCIQRSEQQPPSGTKPSICQKTRTELERRLRDAMSHGVGIGMRRWNEQLKARWSDYPSLSERPSDEA